MRAPRQLSLFFVALLLTLGCFKSMAGSGAERGHGRAPLTGEEIRSAGITSVLEAIRRLRPQYLVSRAPVTGANKSGLPVVYVDNMPYGPVSELQAMPTETVAEIRFISPEDATTRWGTNYPNGVILVTSKR